MNMFNRWILAIRPKTLPAAASPVIVGTALALRDGQFQWGPALAALLGAELLQIGSNLANDVFDYERGTDAGERLGPTRVTQSGLLSPQQVKRGMAVVFGLAALVGLYLIFVGGWPILVLGAAAILSAIAYTGGPFPLGYYGLGDLFVFLFFGLGATAGTYYVQALSVSQTTWWMSIAMGALTVMILVVNNLRDIETDRAAGKKTLAVRLGVRGTRGEYVFCALTAYLIPAMLWMVGLTSPWGMLAWLSLPLTARWIRAIYTQTGRDLNRALAGTGQLELVYAFLFVVGIVLENWFY
ncbi:MAG: 1,4-dihydroxy-2-naphthoate octaprenyltransferase [Chloroflexi bacterium]|nr:1,4-dihydroxy-2-naphthoate octaprenyltransferase [Chloroflexota bacterium]